MGLADCTHVFVCNDTVHKPLQPLYDGHFQVLQRHAHAFDIERKVKRDSVTIDRLKAAFLDSDVTRRACNAEAPKQQIPSNSSERQAKSSRGHIPTPAHPPNVDTPALRTPAGSSNASGSASTRRPIPADAHRSAKVVHLQIDDPDGDVQMNPRSESNAGAVPHPTAQFRPIPAFFEALTTELCGEDILCRRITVPVSNLADSIFYSLGLPGWPKLRGDLSRSKLIRSLFIDDDYELKPIQSQSAN